MVQEAKNTDEHKGSECPVPFHEEIYKNITLLSMTVKITFIHVCVIWSMFK